MRKRPYKVIGYPWLPLIFVVFSAIFVIFSFYVNVRNVVFGLLLVIIGIPLYFWFKKGKEESASVLYDKFVCVGIFPTPP